MYGCAERGEDEIGQPESTNDEYVALDIDNFIDDTVDPSTASAANKRTLRGSSFFSAAATARGNNITTPAAASIDYQFSEYDELLITTPSCTTPSTASDDFLFSTTTTNTADTSAACSRGL